MATPHIKAELGDFAETVIMPGDPLRSRMIAEKFLDNAILVNDVRGIQGYTGYYKGKKISVMASGMGNPTMGIYSYELYKFFGVKRIIRIGSIGAMHKDIPLKSLIIAEKTYTNTNYNNYYINNGENYIPADKELVEQAKNIATQMRFNCISGNTLCSDTFYTDEDEITKSLKLGLLGVEMESASLYINAIRLNKQAVTICTVSNNLITDEETTSEERQNSFCDMIKLALEMA